MKILHPRRKRQHQLSWREIKQQGWFTLFLSRHYLFVKSLSDPDGIIALYKLVRVLTPKIVFDWQAASASDQTRLFANLQEVYRMLRTHPFVQHFFYDLSLTIAGCFTLDEEAILWDLLN